MSAEAKRVKLITLIELFVGLGIIVGAIVLMVNGMLGHMEAAAIGGEGLAALVFGVRGALIANVPARIAKLAKLALIVMVVQAVLLAGAVYLIGVDGEKDAAVLGCGAVLPLLLTTIVFFLSRGMAKRAER